MACSLTVYVYNYESLVIFTMTLLVLDKHSTPTSHGAEGTNISHTPREVEVDNTQAAMDNTGITSCSITDLPPQKVLEALRLMKLPGGMNTELNQLEDYYRADILKPDGFVEAVRRFICGAFNNEQDPKNDLVKAIYSAPRDALAEVATRGNKSSAVKQGVKTESRWVSPRNATLIGFIVVDNVRTPRLIVPIAPRHRLISKEGLADKDTEVLQLLAVAACYRQANSSTETGGNSERPIWLSLKNVDGGVTNSTLNILEENGFQPTTSSMDTLRGFNPSHRSHYRFVSYLEAIVTKSSSDTAQSSTANEAKQPVKEEDNITYPAEDYRSLGSPCAKKS